MASRLQQTLERARAAGLLPADAAVPSDESRPWPVVLLTALGAWLAAVPLLVMVGLLLGDLVTRSATSYLVGTLVLAGALVVLRSRALPLFVEQLAVPALLVGGGTLGIGLFRDLPEAAAATLLAIVSLGFAVAIPRSWLRVLLGALAASLLVVAWTAGSQFVLNPTADGGAAVWQAAVVLLLLWWAALAAQGRWLPGAAGIGVAVVLDSVAAGWLLVALASCVWVSGVTFLVGASLAPGGGFEAARTAPFDAPGDWLHAPLPWGSAGLALVAAAVAALAWPTLRRPGLVVAAVVLVGLAFGMPALGPVLLALVVCAIGQRWRLGVAAALAAAWIVGSFYYRLQWPLASKALLLVVAGALFGAIAWLGRGSLQQPAAVPSGLAAGRRGVAWIGLALVATLVVANLAIWQKERLIATGEPLFVELAPVDPRSLMQGDFMRLNFRMPADLERRLDALVTLERPQVVARRDARGVAALLRVATPDAALAAGELRIELTPRNGRWILVSDAWFYREGEAPRWSAARYGEFRVGPDGRALLVGLSDAGLMPIRP